MSDLFYTSISDLQAGLKAGTFSSVDIMQSVIDRTDSVEDRVKADDRDIQMLYDKRRLLIGEKQRCV